MCGKEDVSSELHREKWAKWPGVDEHGLKNWNPWGRPCARITFTRTSCGTSRQGARGRDWELVSQDLKQNGFPYDRVDLWNNALEWWKLSKSS